MNRQQKIERLIEVVELLRKECPWDRKQTIESLRDNTIEECYELVDAINNCDYDNMREELGDLLLHIIFYSTIADEQRHFNIADVAEAITKKLIYRHPHVFAEGSASSSEEVVVAWEELKQKEKNREDILEGIPSSLPAVMKAYKLQKKAASVGFDWSDNSDVWAKVKEEFSELEQEIEADNHDKIEEEMGDLLFSIVNLARKHDIKPEDALERCNRKFISRFGYLQREAKRQNLILKEMSLEQMDQFWNRAKELEKE